MCDKIDKINEITPFQGRQKQNVLKNSEKKRKEDE